MLGWVIHILEVESSGAEDVNLSFENSVLVILGRYRELCRALSTII